jgi:hypothetical protein
MDDSDRRYVMHALSRHRVGAAGLLLLTSFSISLLSSACASSGEREAPSRATTVIRLEEIQASSASNALELIQQLRSHWLRGRGPTGFRDPQPTLPIVYFEDISYGSLESLRGFSTQGIAEIRFIDPTTATMRFGTGHAGGIIQVIPRR